MSTQQIGTTAFTVAGNLIGAWFGGPVGAAIGGMAGGLIGSLIFGRKNKGDVQDVKLMNSSYGRPIPIVWGKMRLPANMIWQSDITTKSHGIGKGFGGGSTYSYFQSAALAFCEGPVEYKKLYLDGKLFYDNTALFPDELTKYKFTIRPYFGTDFQTADPLMVQWVNSHVLPGGSCPNYHGLAYLVFDGPDLAHFGNRFPQATAIVQSSVIYTTKWNSFSKATPGYHIVTFLLTSSTSIAPDWLRGIVYTFEVKDGETSLRFSNWGIGAYSMYNQTGDRFADWNHIFGDGDSWPADIPEFGPHDITVAQGGNIYMWDLNFGGSHYLLTIDSDSLTFASAMSWPAPTGYPAYGGDSINQMIPFSIVTPNGASTLLMGCYSRLGLFVVNPDDKTASQPFQHQWTDDLKSNKYGLYSIRIDAFATIGHRDDAAGTVDLWYVIANGNDTDQIVYVYKATIRGDEVLGMAEDADITQVAALRPEDWGLPVGTTGTWSPGFDNLFYYPGDDSVVICDSGRNLDMKVDSLGRIGWRLHGGTLGWYNPYAQTDQGYLPFTGGGYIAIILSFGDLFLNLNLATGEITHSPVDGFNDQWVAADPGSALMSNSYGNFVIYKGWPDGNLTMVTMFRQSDNKVHVGDIITDICGRVGVTPDMIDVTKIKDYVTSGFCIQESKSAGSAIADLLHVYQIDMVESDFRLKFVPRGLAPVVTIPQTDLGSVDTRDPSQFWRVKEAQQQELPIYLGVRFQDVGLDFQTGSTYAKRTELPVPTAYSKQRTVMDLPVIVDNAEARGIADKLLWTIWAERDTVETVVPWKYLWIDPADNVQVVLDSGDSYTVRVEETNVGADLSIHLTMAYEDATVYTPAPHLPGALVGFQPQQVTQAPFGTLLQWNVPLLQDSDDPGSSTTRIYYGVGAETGGWVTGELWRSVDKAGSWQDFVAIPNAVNWGRAINALEDTPSKFATDTQHVLTVRMMAGSLYPQSCTYDQMLSGANGALLGSEVIQYQAVTVNADGTVTLSNLLRGRRGTEWATGSHQPGEAFVLLELGRIGARTLSLSEIGVQELWKLVPSGRVLDQAHTTPFTYQGYDLKPYAPVWLKRQPSGADLRLSWTRRTRLAGLLLDGTDTAPLCEDSELYDAYILPNAAAISSFNPGNVASYTRAFMDLSAPSCLYSAAQMAADGFVPASNTLYLAVYQRSGAVGQGFQGYAALPAF